VEVSLTNFAEASAQEAAELKIKKETQRHWGSTIGRAILEAFYLLIMYAWAIPVVLVLYNAWEIAVVLSLYMWLLLGAK
jgi:hypothetical protein